MREVDNYYVAVDADGKATSLALAEGNYQALLGNMPEEYKGVRFVKVAHNKPDFAANQTCVWRGWSQKEDGSISYDWEVSTMSQETCLELWVRGPRNFRLASCDWTQAADSPLSAEAKAEWATYRQALRDMTTVYADVADPADIVWPLAPGEPAFQAPPEEAADTPAE